MPFLSPYYLTFSHSSLGQGKLISLIVSNNLRLNLKKYLLNMIPIKLKFYHNYVISAPHGPFAKVCYPVLLRSCLSEEAFQTNKLNYFKEVSGRISKIVTETKMNLAARGMTLKGAILKAHYPSLTPY